MGYNMMRQSRIVSAIFFITFCLLSTFGYAAELQHEAGVWHNDKHRGNSAFREFVRAMPENGRFVLLRSYLPANGRDNVNMPSITIVKDGKTKTLPECPWRRTSSFDFSAAEDEFSAKRFNVKKLIRKFARVIGLDKRTVAPYCSWWVVVDNKTLNIAFPDASATYWMTPFLAEEGTDLVIEGEYGDMRYMSLAVYDQAFNFFEYSTDGELCPTEDPTRCFGSYITDYQIDPEAGDVNPFQVVGAPENRYKVTITTAPENISGNVLPSLITKSGCLPGQSCNSEEVVDTVQAHSGIMPPPCNFSSTDTTCSKLLQPTSPPTDIQSSVVSNPDNAYIPALYDARDQILPVSLQVPGKVFLIRGKLPITPMGTSPVPWPDSSFDMRYWSICSAVYFLPYPTVESEDACIADLDINRSDEAGNPDPLGEYYTIVLSTAEARPVYGEHNTKEQEDSEYEKRGLNWLEATNFSRGLVILRNMLPSPEFEHAGQNVTRDGSWASAFKVMGDYYPVVTVDCTKSHFEKLGWGACFAPKLDQK